MALKVLSWPVDRGACGYYRVRKPLEALKKYCGAETYVLDMQEDDMQQVVKILPEIDVLYMRPGAEMAMERVREIAKLVPIKAKSVLDIDDNTDVISPYSAFYKEYGLKEFSSNGVDIWKDGVKGFSIEANLRRVTSLHYGMKQADMVTVSTPLLAEHAAQYNPNVYVNDNTIDFNHWWRLNNRINKPLRVVYQGSPSHYEDWFAIKEPLNRLMDEFDFELVMLGGMYKGIFDGKHLDRVRTLPWVHFEAHSYRMMSLQADIGIIPLADLPFNYYKSSIKWYENAAMGVPSVVSNILPYAASIEDGKTALAYKNQTEFYTQMKKLLENKGLRANIANSAYQWVKTNKSQEDEAKKLEKRLIELTLA
jgi:glycosyltransferase involved in cell wall biosynthesis